MKRPWIQQSRSWFPGWTPRRASAASADAIFCGGKDHGPLSREHSTSIEDLIAAGILTQLEIALSVVLRLVALDASNPILLFKKRFLHDHYTSCLETPELRKALK